MDNQAAPESHIPDQPPTAESMPGYGKYFGPNYYGEQDENGVNLSLMRDNLKLTPFERMLKGDAAINDASKVAGICTQHRESRLRKDH